MNEVNPLDMINPNNYVKDLSISNKRFQICKECPELIKLTKTCKKCGCFMKAKTLLEAATCPIGKW
jgi:hypothetical protein